ncbi:nuclear transport factor 2 family protein [Aurantiacibacter sp. MUD61]|uniref:nuclear transport factor 2 family protein n=1 Tax=Aurantiacibacter sp. MUD61 TaxID=3009083 RepID=UPI0022F05501|nr:nuclear transport factor 2 family protein [Aurantiacibacter sp. MUD61]
MSIKKTALAFFEACETSKGWKVCQQWCHPEATFSAQCDSLAEIKTLQAYTDWMGGIGAIMPDSGYEMLAFGVDEERNAVSASAIFTGTHTEDGGPVPPTGKAVATDFTYYIQFEGDKISHMSKIWNDDFAYRQAGWA